MKVYVINLPNSVDRRNSIIKELAKYNLQFELISGVYGKDVDRKSKDIFDEESYVIKNKFLTKSYVHGKLTDGELGCAISHLKVYKTILKNKEDGALVLEDDITLNINIVDVFNKGLEICPNAEYINCSYPKNGLRQSIFAKRHPFVVEGKKFIIYRAGVPYFDWFLNRRRRVGGAYCYYISKTACEKLLQLAYPIRMESDRLLGHVAFNGLKTFLINPSPVKFDNFQSDIGSGRHQKLS